MDTINTHAGTSSSLPADWYPRLAPRLEVYLRAFHQLTREDREDAVQEILLKISKSEHLRDPRRALEPWVFAIARNHCLDLLRKHRHSAVSIPFDEQKAPCIDGAADVSVIHARMEIRELIGVFLESLDDTDRQIAYLRFYEEMKFRDMANILSVPSGTLRYRVHRIKALLAAYLQKEQAL